MTRRRTPRIAPPVSTPDEIWLDVSGYEGMYMVSSLGRVYSYVREKMLKPRPNPKGYLRVAFCRNGRCKDFQIHNVVAIAFLGAIPEGLEVNHKNGVKTDNRPDNFEYGTHQSNVQHAWDMGLRKNRVGGHKLQPNQITEIRESYHRLRADGVSAGNKSISKGALADLATRYGITTAHAYSIAVNGASKYLETQLKG